MDRVFPHHILIIEPDDKLIVPYRFMAGIKHVQRVTSFENAVKALKSTTPDIVFLSASLDSDNCLTLLEKIKDLSVDYIIPIVWVVNFNRPLSTIPGTNWAGKVGIVHTLSSAPEVTATLRRIWEKD